MTYINYRTLLVICNSIFETKLHLILTTEELVSLISRVHITHCKLWSSYKNKNRAPNSNIIHAKTAFEAHQWTTFKRVFAHNVDDKKNWYAYKLIQ